MKYLIDAPKSYPYRGAKNNRDLLSFHETLNCIGKIRITFNYKNSSREYENPHVNIPLFLSEIGDFLGRVNEEKSVRWYLGFAPFAHGRLEEGDLLLSARAGRDFFNEVYDITPAREVSQLKLLVAKDEERFGRLLKRP